MPSAWVAAATIGNAVIASLMAYFGLLAEPISGTALSILFLLVVGAIFLLDECKMMFFGRTTP
jgi:H+-transporting ATPase